MSASRTPPPSPEPTRCPECGEALHCGLRAGKPHCWCMELPAIAPDPSLPPDACLCERCLRRRIAAREGG